MENRILLIAGIIGYYFIQGFLLSAILSSSLVSGAYINSTIPANPNTSAYNQTGYTNTYEDLNSNTGIVSGLWHTFKTMFIMAAGLHLSGMPAAVLLFISFHNWLLFFVLLAAVYRVVNPFAY